MYFNLRNKFVKRKKIRKTFVNLLNFCMGRCGIRSCRFSQRFKQISKYEFAVSLAVRKRPNLYTNEKFYAMIVSDSMIVSVLRNQRFDCFVTKHER